VDYFSLGLIGLFIACFLAATIIPFTSEGVFVLYIIAGYDPLICLLIATVANSIGGFTNYWIGLIGKEAYLKKIFKTDERYLRFKLRVEKHGALIGLFGWVPFIGDPICILLGFIRTPMILTFVFITIGKFARYAIILYFTA
jgi:membrane protein YqaA with SNARE-associated domain